MPTPYFASTVATLELVLLVKSNKILVKVIIWINQSAFGHNPRWSLQTFRLVQLWRISWLTRDRINQFYENWIDDWWLWQSGGFTKKVETLVEISALGMMLHV